LVEPKIVNNQAYYEIKKFKEEGTYISLPFKFSGVSETQRQSEIRKIMNNRSSFCRTNDEVEDVIYNLNEMCDISKYEFTEPFNSMPSYYLVDFDFAKVHISIIDEYHGRGESNYYISVEGVIVEQDVSDLQIQNIVLFLDKTFNG
jgi:hypothetical protein